MPLEPPVFPHDDTGLAPLLSADAIASDRRELQRRIDAANALLDGTALAEAPLEDIARKARGALAEHAAHAWNTVLFWKSLKPAQSGGGEPTGRIGEAISAQFGNFPSFQQRFNDAALAVQDAGWAWLVQRRDGRLGLLATPGATSPITGDDVPLLACNAGEHAYGIDYPDAFDRYLAAFWQLVDWAAVGKRMR